MEVDAVDAERHPLAGLGTTLTRVPRYLVLARSLIGDRRLSRWRKAALAAGIAYLASPIDLIPGILPVVGQIDDLAAVLLALRFALRGLSGATAEARLAEAGLSRAMLDEDLANVRRAAGWVARRAGSLTGSAVRTAASVTAKAGGLAARTTRLALGKGRQAVDAVQVRRHRGDENLAP